MATKKKTVKKKAAGTKKTPAKKKTATKKKPAAKKKVVAKKKAAAKKKVAAKKKPAVQKKAAAKKKTAPKKKAATRKKKPNPNCTFWFEIPVRNLDRAMDFYSRVFQVPFQQSKMDHPEPAEIAMFPGDATMPGCSGALVKSPSSEPAGAGTLVYITVSNLDQVLENIIVHGGTLLVPRTSIGDMGAYAHFQDSEGNRVGVHSFA